MGRSSVPSNKVRCAGAWVSTRALRHPILRWNVSNAVGVAGVGETIKLSKANDKARIDGVAALVNACERMDRHADDGASVYETRGMMRL